MPPETEIEARISEVEDELELLQALRQVRAHARGQNGSRPTEAKDVDLDTLRKRLSTERIEILRAILARGEVGASIPQVVQTTEADRNNVASNLQRMVPAELVERAGRGLYAVTPGGQALIRELDGERP
jgi:DNA-binding IclR family transcriptional regulator